MNGRSQFCGGSLIAPNIVVTAAHCIDSPIVQNDARRVDIVAGTSIFPEGGERIKVAAVYLHPQWERASLNYDVAILTLQAPSALGGTIEIESQEPAVGSTAWVTGWGAVSEGGLGSPDLLGVRLPIVDNATCNARESYNGEITPQMMCAGQRDGGQDSCQGDSGAPFTSEGASRRLIGIVSWGSGCGRRLKYGVYTRVSTVAPWIKSFLTR